MMLSDPGNVLIFLKQRYQELFYKRCELIICDAEFVQFAADQDNNE